MGNNLENTKIQWHSGFYGAAELEFGSDKEVLEFNREYNLSKEPLRMDLLIQYVTGGQDESSQCTRVFAHIKKGSIVPFVIIGNPRKFLVCGGVMGTVRKCGKVFLGVFHGFISKGDFLVGKYNPVIRNRRAVVIY